MAISEENAASKQYVQKPGSAVLRVGIGRNKNSFVEAREKGMAVTEM